MVIGFAGMIEHVQHSIALVGNWLQRKQLNELTLHVSLDMEK